MTADETPPTPGHAAPPVIGPLLLGMVLLAVTALLTLTTGLYGAFFGKGELTLEVLRALIVNPSPYVMLAIASLLIYHARKLRAVALTFNAGTALLAGAWFGMNAAALDGAAPLAERLQDTLGNNAIAAGVLAVLIAVVMLLQTKLAPR
jgi:hypothetical protein